MAPLDYDISNSVTALMLKIHNSIRPSSSANKDAQMSKIRKSARGLCTLIKRIQLLFQLLLALIIQSTAVAELFELHAYLSISTNSLALKVSLVEAFNLVL